MGVYTKKTLKYMGAKTQEGKPIDPEVIKNTLDRLDEAFDSMKDVKYLLQAAYNWLDGEDPEKVLDLMAAIREASSTIYGKDVWEKLSDVQRKVRLLK